MIYLRTGHSAQRKQAKLVFMKLLWFCLIYLHTGYPAKRKPKWFPVIYLHTWYSVKGN